MVRASINRSLPCGPRLGGVLRRWPNVSDTAIILLHGDCLIHRETNRSFSMSRATKSPIVDEILLKVVFGCKKEKGGVSCR